MKSLLRLSHAELVDLLNEYGQKPFRAQQLRQWMVEKSCSDFSEMRNLPGELRTQLAQDYTAYPLKIDTVQKAKDGTVKFTSRTEDNELVETVVMKYSYGWSICLSSQIGCAMQCTFCASGLAGLVRNLRVDEMVAQILLAQQIVGEEIRHVVFMGMGEPLANYDQLILFFEFCRDEKWGRILSLRNITVSTSGLVPAILKLAEENYPVTLAISLHAVTDKVRRRLLPIAGKYTIKELMAAGDYYTQRTGRRVSYEYLLIDGINADVKDAKALTELLRGRIAHVNLISYNEVKELPWEAPTVEQVEAFAHQLQSGGIETTVRRSLGEEIDAACGQLRRRRK